MTRGRKPKRPAMPLAFDRAEIVVYRHGSAEDVVRFLAEQIDREVQSAVSALGEDRAAIAAAVRWAESLTSTNCGWAEYEIGKRALPLLEIAQAEALITEALSE